jgi:hypothetical protein
MMASLAGGAALVSRSPELPIAASEKLSNYILRAAQFHCVRKKYTRIRQWPTGRHISSWWPEPAASAAALSSHEISKFEWTDVAFGSNCINRAVKCRPTTLCLSHRIACLYQFAFLGTEVETTLASLFFLNLMTFEKVGKPKLDQRRNPLAGM